MDLHIEWLGPDDGIPLPTFTARPARAAGPLPTVVVIQEVWGVDSHMQDVTRRFAEAGYLAAAPALYAHGGTLPSEFADWRIALVKETLDGAPANVWTDPQARAAAFDAIPGERGVAARESVAVLLNPNRPIARYLADLRASVLALSDHAWSSGRIGSVGYCMGGMLSALLAGCTPSLAAAAIYYGSSPSMDAMRELNCPVLGFYGELDTRVTSTVGTFEEGLRAAGKRIETHVYAGAPHAFFNDTRRSFHLDASRDAWARTLLFFARTLAG
jgi:carboxymethylenebutenolidase